MDADNNLLFGVLALQSNLLDAARFAEACAAWAARKDQSLADLLVERRWLTPADRAAVEKLLERQKTQAASTGPVSPMQPRTADTLATEMHAGLPLSPVVTTLAQPGHHLPSADRAPSDGCTPIRLHAMGGLGRVWLARDEALGREVALKELRPERATQPSLRARFLKEACITGQLEHPGIVPIYQLGRRPFDDAPFYTMRFVRGRTLAEAVAAYHARRARNETGLADLRELLTAFVAVCNALAYAHARGVLHRDLKPQNVVLGDFGEAIVLDWGLARLIGQAAADDESATRVPVAGDGAPGETVEGQVLGTPAYMAPEQAEGRLDELGAATDVYGLGAILYEILTGGPPFTGPDSADVLSRVVHAEPTAPRVIVPGVPAALEAVCLKALAKTAAARYPSAKALAADVGRWLADEPVSAWREPWGVRAARWSRRHRVLVTGAAAAALVALVGLAAVLTVQARSNRQLREANARERERVELALDAIRTFHTGVSEDVLLKQAGFQALRKKLLNGAADFYRKLEARLAECEDADSRAALGNAYAELAELTGAVGSKDEALALHERALAVRESLLKAPDAGPGARADVGKSLLQQGRLQFDMGKPADARAAYERARELLDAAVRDRPDEPRFQSELAACHTALALLKAQTGHRGNAVANYEAALSLHEGLAAAHPNDTHFQREWARSLLNTGISQWQAGHDAEALSTSEKASAVYRQLADAHPEEVSFQFGLGQAHDFVGTIYHYTSKRAEALQAHERAGALFRAVAEAQPAVGEYQIALARTLANLGYLKSDARQSTQALAYFDQAQAIWRKLADANPAVPEYQFYLADSYNDIGDMKAQENQWDKATAAYEHALTIAEAVAAANPTLTEYQYRLARSLKRAAVARQHSSRPAEAVAALRRAIARLDSLRGQVASDIERTYNLACFHALLSGLAAADGSGLSATEGRAAADRAVELLRQAIAAGFGILAALESDTDLDPIRKRADFQLLLREMTSKAKNAKP